MPRRAGGGARGARDLPLLAWSAWVAPGPTVRVKGVCGQKWSPTRELVARQTSPSGCLARETSATSAAWPISPRVCTAWSSPANGFPLPSRPTASQSSTNRRCRRQRLSSEHQMTPGHWAAGSDSLQHITHPRPPGPSLQDLGTAWDGVAQYVNGSRLAGRNIATGGWGRPQSDHPRTAATSPTVLEIVDDQGNHRKEDQGGPGRRCRQGGHILDLLARRPPPGGLPQRSGPGLRLRYQSHQVHDGLHQQK